MFRLSLTVVLAVGVLATACGSSDDGASQAAGSEAGATTAPGADEATGADESSTAEEADSGGSCGSGGDLSGPVQERTIDSGDIERTWLLALPSGYEEGSPSDVVVNFHGAGSSADEQYRYGNFIRQAERDDVILVMPNSREIDDGDRVQTLWEAGVRPDDTDVDFVQDLVALLREEYCTGEFFAAGMSSGGDMTAAMACESDSPFAAYGPVTLISYDEGACGDAAPRPIVYFHGTDDVIVPFEGTDEPWLDRPIPQVVQDWADHNGCEPDRLEEAVSPEVTRYHWEGCEAPTEWYLVDGGGHTWPGAADISGLGYVTDDISASDIIWEHFFA